MPFPILAPEVRDIPAQANGLGSGPTNPRAPAGGRHIVATGVNPWILIGKNPEPPPYPPDILRWAGICSYRICCNTRSFSPIV